MISYKERERTKIYRRTETCVYVEHIEPHIEHLMENEGKKKVSGNNVTSVDANKLDQDIHEIILCTKFDHSCLSFRKLSNKRTDGRTH